MRWRVEMVVAADVAVSAEKAAGERKDNNGIRIEIQTKQRKEKECVLWLAWLLKPFNANDVRKNVRKVAVTSGNDCWHCDAVMLWRCGFVMLWHFGAETLRRWDAWILRCRDPVTLWSCFTVTLWYFDAVILWKCDVAMLWDACDAVMWYYDTEMLWCWDNVMLWCCLTEALCTVICVM